MIETAQAIAKGAVFVREALGAAGEEFIPCGEAGPVSFDDDLHRRGEGGEVSIRELIHQRLHFVGLQDFEDVLGGHFGEQIGAFLHL